MDTIRVNLGPRSYDISFVHDAFAEFGPFVRSRLPKARKAFIVSDANTIVHAERTLHALSSAGFDPRLASVPAGEKTKSLEMASQLYDLLADAGVDRQTPVVAVGGGVVGDLAGFVAATYNRGLPLMMIPTSLLAMVDSSVGGKVGINHPRGKNLIGAFHQPAGVWIDTSLLATLPEREFRSGLAEVVKYGVILDAEFFQMLLGSTEAILRHDPGVLLSIIKRCCQLKAMVVEQDEREETGLRMILNYGHTFGHAFESVGGYGAWFHGEAVAAGMICASRLAEKRGLISSDVTQAQWKLLRDFQLPVAPLSSWSVDELILAMTRDKKAEAGRLRFILPTRLGEVKVFDDIPEEMVRRALTGEISG